MKKIALLILTTALAGASALAAGKQPFKVKGEFIDSCACGIPCSCPMGTIERGCEGVGAMVIHSGKYGSTDLGGAKIAYAVSPGKWVRGYVDARNPEQAKAAQAFARSALAAFGKVEFVKPARVDVAGKNGDYKLAVNGGKTMKVTTKPVLGGDKRSPIVHTNLDDPLNDKFYQAKTISGSYSDQGRSFKLKGSNAYFNNQLNKSGSI
jgi:hypothetical protein